MTGDRSACAWCGLVWCGGEVVDGFGVEASHDQIHGEHHLLQRNWQECEFEGAQIDSGNDEQRAILRGSTHFNPVDLVCAVRDALGRPYDLHHFIDPDAVIITRKSAAGRELQALERPGLWNGAMAEWNTVFVEVPLTTFAPVKTVLDLLREEHQPAG